MIVLEEHSKITAKGQTTVPKRIRDTLGVRFGDEIVYRVTDDGAVTVESARAANDGAAIDAFLDFISDDIKRNPHRVTPIDRDEMAEMRALVDGVEVDLEGDFTGAEPL